MESGAGDNIQAQKAARVAGCLNVWRNNIRERKQNNTYLGI